MSTQQPKTNKSKKIHKKRRKTRDRRFSKSNEMFDNDFNSGVEYENKVF